MDGAEDHGEVGRVGSSFCLSTLRVVIGIIHVRTVLLSFDMVSSLLDRAGALLAGLGLRISLGGLDIYMYKLKVR